VVEVGLQPLLITDYLYPMPVRAEPVEAGAQHPQPFGLSLSKPGRARMLAEWAACLCKGRRPGVARHASNFLSRRRKKVTKERATPSLRPLRGAKGQPASVRLRGAPWNSLCAARTCAHAHPATAPPQAQPAGVGGQTAEQPNFRTATRAIALLGRDWAARVVLACCLIRSHVGCVFFLQMLGNLRPGVATGDVRGRHRTESGECA